MILLGGCLDRLLEAPYVLAPGLGEVRSVAIAPEGGLLVAGAAGVFHVDGEGHARRMGEPATAVSSTPGHTWTLREGWIEDGPRRLEVRGAVDVLGGFEGLLVLWPDHVETVDVDTLARAPLATGLDGARALALGPDQSYLVVTRDTLLQLREGRTTTLASGLTDARAAATDRRGRVYVAQGSPQALWRVEAGRAVLVAEWLDDPRDLHFGVGGLLPEENVYVANGAGTLDYARPP